MGMSNETFLKTIILNWPSFIQGVCHLSIKDNWSQEIFKETHGRLIDAMQILTRLHTANMSSKAVNWIAHR